MLVSSSAPGSGKGPDIPFGDEKGGFLSPHPSPVVWGHSDVEEEGLVPSWDVVGRDRDLVQSEGFIFILCI